MLLGPGEEQERRDAEQDGDDGEVGPDGEVAREALTGDRRDDQECQGAGCHPAENDLTG